MRLKVRRRGLLVGLMVVVVGLGVAGGAAGVYASTVDRPALPPQDGSTEIRYADGTVMARVGKDEKVPVDTARLPPYVAAAVLAAQDPDFRDDRWFGRPSRLSVQYTRTLLGDPGLGSARLALAAGKLEDHYGKDTILRRYLNNVYFGRLSYGVEAAAGAYFGKSAGQLTKGEAVLLAAQLDAPGDGAFDPTLHADAARRRFDEIRKAMPGGADAEFPARTLTVAEAAKAREALHPTGPAALVVRRVLEELTAVHQRPEGARVTTTIDPKLQQALVAQADATVDGSVLRGQPDTLQAGAVAVQPGTGRVLAYYGGATGSGFDYAGQHPPGNAFSAITLAAAVLGGVSLQSQWLAPAEMDFPASGRLTRQGNAVRDVKRCPGAKPSCSLLDVQRDGLRVPLFAVAEKIGPGKIVDMARLSGIDTMWSFADNQLRPVPLNRPAAELYPKNFNTEIAFGQYPVTLLDEANAMATFAAGGQRARVHLVTEVSYVDDPADRPALRTDERAAAAVDGPVVQQVTWALSQQPAGRLADGRPTAAAVGEWQVPLSPEQLAQDPRTRAPQDLTKYAHASIAGYTPQVAVAVWVGNKRDERPLIDRTGAAVTGATLPALIYRQFLTAALAGVPPTAVVAPPPLGDPRAGNATTGR